MRKAILTGLGLVLVGLAIQVSAEKNPVLPPPYETPSTPNPSTILGWPEGKTPIAPEGFTVSEFARLVSPRNILVLPSGNILISQSAKKPDDNGENSPNIITKFKMNGSEIVEQTVLLENVKLPFGLAVLNDELYVSEPERILAYSFVNEEIAGEPRIVVELPFPKPQRHWTRDIKFSADGSKMYVSVGSVSNVGESPDPLHPHTAAILQLNPDGSDVKVFAGGVRNAVTMAWEPVTGSLWATVNERDELGDFLPPDYLIKVKEGGFYGWPYAYWGKNEDPRRKGERPDLVAISITPDFSVGAHTAATGIMFTAGSNLPSAFNSGALITQHGSWNSVSLVGYKIIYVPFENGEAVDGEKDFLTGFIADIAKSTVYGRPVTTAILADGTVLVADDGGGRIWKVTPPTVVKK